MNTRILVPALAAVSLALTSSYAVTALHQSNVGANGWLVISAAGSYTLDENITGNLLIDASNVTLTSPAAGKPVIHGTSNKTVTPPNSGGSVNSDDGHVRILGNFVTINGGTDKIRIENSNGQSVNASSGNNITISNLDCETVNLDPSGYPVPSTGGVVFGDNSSMSSSVFKVGDDAVKLTEASTSATNCTVTLRHTGTALQYGWSNKNSGDHHTASNITITSASFTDYNPNSPNGTSGTPGRSLIAGEAENAVTDFSVTNFTCNALPAAFAFCVNLDAQAGGVWTGIDMTLTFPAGSSLDTKTNSAGSKFSSIDLGADGAGSTLTGVFKSNANKNAGFIKTVTNGGVINATYTKL